MCANSDKLLSMLRIPQATHPVAFDEDIEEVRRVSVHCSELALFSNNLSVLTSCSERFSGFDGRCLRIALLIQRSETKNVIDSKRSIAGIVRSIPSRPVMERLVARVTKTAISATRSQRISKLS